MGEVVPLFADIPVPEPESLEFTEPMTEALLAAQQIVEWMQSASTAESMERLVSELHEHLEVIAHEGGWDEPPP